MSCQQTVEVVEEAWRPASAAVRASLLQMLFGPLDGAHDVAPMAGVGPLATSVSLQVKATPADPQSAGPPACTLDSAVSAVATVQALHAYLSRGAR